VSRKRESSARLVAGATGRRSIRLRGYDYTHPGAYFITVCAIRRGPFFGWISDGRVIENGNARIVRDCWSDLPDHYPHVSLDAFVVMPDHIHGIIVLLDTYGAGCKGTGLTPAPTDGDAFVEVGVRHGLPQIVRALKTYSARRINATRGTPGASICERGYYERIVRNERELNLTRKYITNNPRNWRTNREHNNPHR
jgi:putative transposase